VAESDGRLKVGDQILKVGFYSTLSSLLLYTFFSVMTKRYIKLCYVNRNFWKKNTSLTWKGRDAYLQFFSFASPKDGLFGDR